MNLYHAPGACSVAPHIVLCELGLPHRLSRVDLQHGRTADGRDFKTVNPKGYVPALELEDGSVLTEVSALLQYLADRAPGAHLLPAVGTPERYRVLEWIGFIATEIHKGFGPLWAPDTSEDAKSAARARLGQRFDYVVAALGEREYLAGPFTIADPYLYTVLNWTQWTGIDRSRWPTLQRYVERVAARPAVRAALQAEGLTQ
jgi:glutathione S-transferase